jgi:hypothetical protein
MADSVRPAIIAAIAALVVGGFTAAGAVWGSWSNQRQANKLSFLNKQLELSFQASETSARLATETDREKWKEAQGTFWRLYWGPLSIVEDPAVEAAMVRLGGLVPPPGAEVPRLPMTVLQQPSLQLGHATRDLVLRSWNVDLPALRDARP